MKTKRRNIGGGFCFQIITLPWTVLHGEVEKGMVFEEMPQRYIFKSHGFGWLWLIYLEILPPSIDTDNDIWWSPSLRMIGPFKAFASQCLPRHELLSNIQYLKNDHINDNCGWFWVPVPFLASIFQSMLLSHSHSHDNWLTSSWLPHKVTEGCPCYRTGRQLGSNYGFFATNLKLAVLVPKIHWSATQNEANA